MRVVHVIPLMTVGGAETVLYRLVTTGSKVEHQVICLGGRGTYSGLFESAGISLTHLNMGSTGISGLLKLFNSIRKSGGQVVQCWMYRANLLGGLTARLAGLPVVWNIRCSSIGPLRRGSKLLVYMGGALARWIPDMIVNCSAKSANLHQRLGYGHAEGVLIPNGYDPDLFSPDEAGREAARRSLDLRPKQFVIGSIGRWHPMKGYGLLVHAVHLLRNRGVPAFLLLVGRGLEENNRELMQIIAANGCMEFVRLLGERSDVRDVARALDLHVLASIGSEGFPNVVAETMLSATPNVATDVGDSALIVGDTGWVVPPDDAEALADAIERAYNEHASAPKEWVRRRRSARQRIVENFSLERMIHAYEGVWRKVAGTALQELE